MPAVATYSPTGNAYIDSLFGDRKWAVNSLTYSFPTSGSYYGSSYGDGENVTNFGAFTATQQAATREALKMYASVANLRFTEIAETATQHADLRFAMSDKPSTAWAYFPTTAAEGGDSWFNKSGGYYKQPEQGNYAYLTIMHEIGHALGLEHAHEGRAMPQSRDSMEYTVMSYRSYVGASTTSGYVNETWGYAQTLMMYDIAALQHMYGANYTTNSGNTVYSWSPTTGEMLVNGVGQGAPGGNRVFQTVWDGGGNDTYDFSNYTTPLAINLQPGAWSTIAAVQLAKLHYNGTKVAAGNIANALLHKGDARSLVENAVGGSGNDTLTGNQAANSLKGGAGNDRLSGGAGNDVINGGTGSDTAIYSGQRSYYDVAKLSDGSVRISDLRSGSTDGTDVIWNVEWFQFVDALYSLAELPTGTIAGSAIPASADTQNLIVKGVAKNDKLYGGAGNDRLYGYGGNDVLTGGSGKDVLSGGAGTDMVSYRSAAAGVLVDLAAAKGYRSDAAGDVLASVENLLGSRYSDSLRGNNAANSIRAGAGNDTLYGRGGNDVLRGDAGKDLLHGGAGRDILIGGSGADTFIFRSVSESRGSTLDTIRDFARGVDKIDLRKIDADTGLSGNQAFSFIGKSEFSGNAGELRFSDGILSGDINGDQIADFQVKVAGRSVLAKSDFYL